MPWPVFHSLNHQYLLLFYLLALLPTLSNDNVAQAVAIASIPEDIRGYGHVKERHLKAAKEKEAALIAAFNAPAAPTGSAPRAA